MSEKMEISSLQQLFIDYGKCTTFGKWEMVFSKDEPADNVYYIEEGLLKICQMTFSGQDVTFFIRKTNEYFGMAEIILHRAHSCYAQCLRESRIRILPSHFIQRALAARSDIVLELLQTMTDRLMQQELTVEQLASKSVSSRVAWLLSQLYRHSQRQPMSFPVLLTHQEMSNIVGCSRQTLSEVFNEWRTNGIIHYTRGKLTILRPDQLQKEL
ncbi:MAG: Crp/Fnr family transcriptional regulator [Sporolactobacillus sp.]